MTFLWSQSITAGIYNCGENISDTCAAGELTIRDYIGFVIKERLTRQTTYTSRHNSKTYK